MVDSKVVYTVHTLLKAVGFTALEDVAEAASLILMEGPVKTQSKGLLVFSDVLTPRSGG